MFIRFEKDFDFRLPVFLVRYVEQILLYRSGDLVDSLEELPGVFICDNAEAGIFKYVLRKSRMKLRFN